MSRERFDSKVDRNGPVPSHRPELGPCHIWTAQRTKQGYGRFWLNGKDEQAHRVAFFLANGRWPEPYACHRCDNTGCVRIEHLFEGTPQDNMDDMSHKGRARSGARKLSDQDVRDIRANFTLCRVTQTDLAIRFGVTVSAVWDIVHGRTHNRT